MAAVPIGAAAKKCLKFRLFLCIFEAIFFYLFPFRMGGMAPWLPPPGYATTSPPKKNSGLSNAKFFALACLFDFSADLSCFFILFWIKSCIWNFFLPTSYAFHLHFCFPFTCHILIFHTISPSCAFITMICSIAFLKIVVYFLIDSHLID